MNQKDKKKLRTWIELDKKALKENYLLFRKIIKKPTLLMAVVKSNAYGHGIIEISKEVSKFGVDYLGVDSFEEALEIRKNKIKTPILVLGYVSSFYFREAINKNITITISSISSLESIKKSIGKINVHLKVDTGLGRQGFLFEEISKVIYILSKNKNINVKGIYSHLAVGEDPKEKNYTKIQVEKLLKWEEALASVGYNPICHICATSSTMLFPEFHFDMVRIGIGIYGLWPSEETKKSVGSKYKLNPVLSWKATITEIKKFKKGSKIGYDLTEELKKDSTVAVVPVGYWHGYSRLLSSKGYFSLKGHKAKVIGRVSMDMVVVDITGIKNIKAGDEIEIIGGNNGYNAHVDTMAEVANTINYETVTKINPFIKRFFVKKQ